MKVASLYSASHRALVELLKDLRVLARMTQVDVAAALNRPQSYVSNLEAGRRGIDLFQIEELAALYGYGLTNFVALFEKEKRKLMARIAARDRRFPRSVKKAPKALQRAAPPARPRRAKGSRTTKAYLHRTVPATLRWITAPYPATAA